MKSKLLIVAMLFMFAITACANKPFPPGMYKPVEQLSTTRITEFKFAEDGTFAVLYYNGLKAGGAYTVSSGRITLSESEDSPCFGYPITMTWTYSGNTLTLKTVEDTCPAMPTTDWAGEWSREP